MMAGLTPEHKKIVREAVRRECTSRYITSGTRDELLKALEEMPDYIDTSGYSVYMWTDDNRETLGIHGTTEDVIWLVENNPEESYIYFYAKEELTVL